jgi:hypothetical protein
MAKLRRVGVLFFAKLFAIVMLVFGLAGGLIYSIGGMVHDIATTQSVNQGTALAFLAVVGMPALFAAAGFIAGVIGAPIYNFAARWFGGIELDIEQ